MPDALDPIPLLRHLSERGVEHIVIGGFAVNAHGYVRASKDLDTVPNSADGNLERLAEALAAINAVGAEEGDFAPAELARSALRAQDLAQGGNFRLLTDLGDRPLRGARSTGHRGGRRGRPDPRLRTLEHLLAMKRAAGRPQDLEDVKRLGGV
jgi:hypothetical protein